MSITTKVVKPAVREDTIECDICRTIDDDRNNFTTYSLEFDEAHICKKCDKELSPWMKKYIENVAWPHKDEDKNNPQKYVRSLKKGIIIITDDDIMKMKSMAEAEEYMIEYSSNMTDNDFIELIYNDKALEPKVVSKVQYGKRPPVKKAPTKKTTKPRAKKKSRRTIKAK